MDNLTARQRRVYEVLLDKKLRRLPPHSVIASKAKLPSRGAVGSPLAALRKKVNPATGKPYIDEDNYPIEG